MNKVIEVKAKDNHILSIKMSNKKVGEFDVSPYLNKGIFKELVSIKYFKQVVLSFGGVAWPHQQDFSADTIEMEMVERKIRGI